MEAYLVFYPTYPIHYDPKTIGRTTMDVITQQVTM
jgi:hypothetical protein